MLFLRNVLLDWEGNIGYLDARHLVCDNCSWVPMPASSLRDQFYQLGLSFWSKPKFTTSSGFSAISRRPFNACISCNKGFASTRTVATLQSSSLNSNCLRSHGSCHGRRANRRLLQMMIQTRSPSCSKMSSRCSTRRNAPSSSCTRPGRRRTRWPTRWRPSSWICSLFSLPLSPRLFKRLDLPASLQFVALQFDFPARKRERKRPCASPSSLARVAKSAKSS